MARERAITRTINAIEVSAICMNIETMENTVEVLSLTGDVPTDEQLLKKLRKIYETNTYKVVAIKDIKTIEKLFGMPEVEFLKYAKELDPDTRKPLNA